MFLKKSTICCARIPKAHWAHSFSSSRMSESYFVLASKVSSCNLWFAVACDCGLTCFCQIMTSTSANVRLLLAFKYLNVIRAILRRCD